MTRHLGALAVVMSATAFAGTQNAGQPGGSRGLIVHEWGTFTSIAGEDGGAVQWLPQAGPSDLPDFVDKISCRLKGSLSGVVRMETPVVYFYAPRALTVNVDVQFRQGVMTEWFPRPRPGEPVDGTVNDAFTGRLAWRNVHVRPGVSETEFPVEPGDNHYYLARNTDAAPLQVGSQRERFLFYRGVGRLPPPIAATVEPNGQIVVNQTRGDALGDIILFENRDGAQAFQARRTSAARVAFEGLEPEGEGASPQAYLTQVLVAHGLYPKEAAAMVETWRGSWFEQGVRVFYIASNETVNTILPLRIDPTPDEIRRVFVGRLEIATPTTLREVKIALESQDRVRLAQYGRFLQPIGKQLLSTVSPAERPAMQKRLESAAAPWIQTSTTCSAASPQR